MKNSQILERKIKKNIYIGIGPQDLLDDLNTMGFLFKNLCIRDLRIYADFLDGTIYHYRYRYNTYEKTIFPTNTMCKRTLRVQEKRWNICCAYYKT